MACERTRTALVYAGWENPRSSLMGILRSSAPRGREIFSFEFDGGWLERDKGLDAGALDPELSPTPGFQYPSSANFGMFLDSSPDRWGRRLMLRREAILSRRDGRKAERLSEFEFLVGVADATRMGGLRFKFGEDGCFESPEGLMPTPPFARLRQLEAASRDFEESEDGADSGRDDWLDVLFAPGSSLGGARPKAGVVDAEGSLWIAKFPSKGDEYDSGAWEGTINELARNAGIGVPEFKVERLSARGSTFLSKRFDRHSGGRVHFASAMTLVGARDGDGAGSGTGYLDIAEAIARFGLSPGRDMEELWRRIVFNMAVSNTDDHLRNHGFLLHPGGWRLSPVFDINPDIQSSGLSLNVSENDNSLDFGLALSVSEQYRVPHRRAVEILADIRSAVSRWREVATEMGIPKTGIELMEPAFAQVEKKGNSRQQVVRANGTEDGITI